MTSLICTFIFDISSCFLAYNAQCCLWFNDIRLRTCEDVSKWISAVVISFSDLYIDSIILRYSNEVVVLKIVFSGIRTLESGRSLQIFRGTYCIHLQGGRVCCNRIENCRSRNRGQEFVLQGSQWEIVALKGIILVTDNTDKNIGGKCMKEFFRWQTALFVATVWSIL
jgi:hypothetical protein